MPDPGMTFEQWSSAQDQRTCERLAKRMHEAYEDLAPKHGWATQERSRKPWEEVPEANRQLMIEVMRQVMLPALANAVATRHDLASILRLSDSGPKPQLGQRVSRRYGEEGEGTVIEAPGVAVEWDDYPGDVEYFPYPDELLVER